MAIVAEKEITTLRGTFKGGVIVLDDLIALPEGTLVTINVPPQKLPAEMQSEFMQWDKASADAWRLIAEWEAEEGEDPETLA